MSRLRAIAGLLGRGLLALFEAIRGEPETSEGAVNLGLVGLLAGFLVAGQPALALILPSLLLVVLGSLPAIAKVRGH